MMTNLGSGDVSVGMFSAHVNAAGGGVGATANQAASDGRRSVVDVSEAGGSETTGDADSTPEAASAAEVEGNMNGESGSEDQAGRTEAAEANGVSDSEGAESGARQRGMWGAPQQPFPAAGSIPVKGEAAGTLITGDTTAVVVTDSGSTAGTTAAAAHDQAAEHLAVTAMETGSSQPLEGLQQAPATAQQTTATTESGGLVSPELQQELALAQPPESTAQPPASTARPPESTAQLPESTAQLSESTAQPPVATATTSNETAARPAAGQYRRVAWAPVYNPFPAAGLSGAIGKQPQLPALTDPLDIAKQQASTLSAVSNGEASSGDAMPGRSLTQEHVPDSIHGIQHVTESTSQAQAVSGPELESAEGLTHPADGSAAAEQHNPEESEAAVAAECPPSHSMQQVLGEQVNLQLYWAYH